MKYEAINAQLFVHNRKNFAERLPEKAMAIFYSNDVLPTTADGTYPFHQHRDLFYLTGVDQEDTALLLFPDAPVEKYREVLFVRRTNEFIATWEGDMLTQEQAAEVSGVKTVLWFDELDNVLKTIVNHARTIYIDLNEHDRGNSPVPDRNRREADKLQQQYPFHIYERSAPIMEQLRMFKHDIELELMQRACDITEKGFRRVLEFVKPGVHEYEIEAEISREFIRNRATKFAYHPIIASGKDSCVLHYTKNNKQCSDGDVLLMDFGCEYANYASDLTRTIPVSGRYSHRQKAVYNAVLNVQKEATDMLRPGTKLDEFQKEVGKLVEAELVNLGLLNKEDIANQDPGKPLYKKYFMHGTSHYIGLDTHDVGDRFAYLKPGMAFTVEPGIYIPEEGIGVRIENDVVVTDNAPHDLMRNIPREAEEIEELMNAG